ncbi:hypothetical protein R1flu_006819 [Riccia fluitans]|uniref:Uncharacterized protein n=1 Tax=Riccia fluitans TaxID=41844 RepID=A0ABD1YXE5_9MARC
MSIFMFLGVAQFAVYWFHLLGLPQCSLVALTLRLQLIAKMAGSFSAYSVFLKITICVDYNWQVYEAFLQLDLTTLADEMYSHTRRQHS